MPLSTYVSPNSYEQTLHTLRLLGVEVTMGLRFLHKSARMVHQDIKPANIMVSAFGHVVIGDFGAATRLPPCSGIVSSETWDSKIILQPHDTVTFTPFYAAPELLQRTSQGLVIYDERVDWWALGIMLYELATGSLPFRLSDEVSGDVNYIRRILRSDGDSSVAFGKLESLRVSAAGDWDQRFEGLLRSVSVFPSSYNFTLIGNSF